jgi:hypothetical protein
MQLINLVQDLRPVILAAREIRDSRNTLARFLPNRNVQAVSYRMGRRNRVDQTVPIRAIDSPATPIRRPGLVDVRGDLPAITPIVDLTEQDLTNDMIIAQQLAGLQVDFQPSVEASAAIAALTVEISRIAEDGTTHEVDFEVPTDQVITAGAPWDFEDPAAVFADYSAAAEVFLDASGASAGVVLASNNMKTLLLNAVQKLFPQAPVSIDTLNAYLGSRELPQVATYDRKLRDASGQKTRIYPDGQLTFLPADADPIGETQLGVTQEAVQQVQGRILTAQQAAGLTIVTLGEDNPVRRAVKGAALGMPILRDNEDIVILKGLK